MNWTMEPPTQPGTYWFRRELTSMAIMVEVRVTDGVLTVWWPDIDQPVGLCANPSTVPPWISRKARWGDAFPKEKGR